jgi:hypothetical protein
MKRTSLVVLSFLLAPSLFADAGQHLIPAGSLIGCTISEPRLSSKTTAVGDPVMCRVGHSGRYGGAVLPYNSYLVGEFEGYRDPGHFVGKGWMELRFDRMVIEPDTVIPIDARVVDVPGYRVDREGRIIGKGHETRDIVLWTIPVLWPIDLLMLPMRGPRPALKQETRLTLKVMDDLSVPSLETPQADPYGLMRRQTGENDPPPQPAQIPQFAPETAAYTPVQEAPAPQPVYYYVPVYVAPPMYYPPMVVAYPPPPVFAYSPMRYMSTPAAYGYAVAGWGYPATYGYDAYAPQVAVRPAYRRAYYSSR